MKKEDYSFVLEDDLFAEYHRFMNPGSPSPYHSNTIKKLLAYHTKPFLFNKEQLDRCSIPCDRNLEITLRKNRLNGLELDELYKKTFYHGILSNDKDEYPYININNTNEKIISSISGSYYARENREKAKSHIRSLCSSAKKIIVYDRYLTSSPEDIAVETLADLLPQNEHVTIILHNTAIGTSYNPTIAKDKLKLHYNNWTIDNSTTSLRINSHHDRYIIIDDSMEIILSSGLTNLGDDQKDFTYLLSPYRGHI